MVNREIMEDSLPYLKVDDSLENRLKVHGFNRRNVKSIIRSIFSDQNVLTLLDGINDEQELDFPEAPVTRSKRRNEFSNETEDCDNTDLVPYSVEENALMPAEIVNDDTNSKWTECSQPINVDTLSDDAYVDANGDFDWKNWLYDVDGETCQNAKSEQSDSDSDYDFLAELEDQDDEDYRFDRTTKISKKELKSLKRKRRTRNTAKKANNASVGNRKVPKIDHIKSPILQKRLIENFMRCTTAREKLKFLRSNPRLHVPQKKRPRPVQAKHLTFTDQQRNMLVQQMQQHVQLLTTGSLLNRTEEADLSSFLHEIEYFKAVSPNPDKSAFNVSNLGEALKITSADSPSYRSDDGTVAIMRKIANSPVFMYRELLPQDIRSTETNIVRSKISYHEDCLIAHGCHEMESNFMSISELIHELLLPCISKEKISNRIKCIVEGKMRDFTSNPVFHLKMLGILPRPCEKVQPVVWGNAVKPLDLPGVLPQWLNDLKMSTPIHEGIDNIPAGTVAKQPVMDLEGDIARSTSRPVFWTKEMDRILLCEIKRHNGLTSGAFSALDLHFPNFSRKMIKQRFDKLMRIYCKMMG